MMFPNNLFRKLLTQPVRSPRRGTIRNPQHQVGRIEHLEDRITPAFTSILAGLDATINGDAAADTFLVTVDTATTGGPFLVHNRFTEGDAGFASNLDWDSSVAGEQKLAADASVTLNFVNLGGGDDTLQIVRGADGVTGSGDINAFIDTDSGGAGDDSLIVDDSTRTTANTLTFDAGALSLTGTGYNIDLGMAAEAGFFITTGTADDTVNVLGTFGGQQLFLDSAGGAETVNVGSAGSLTDILAAVNVSNSNGLTTLTIDASADGAATYTVTDTQVTSTLAPAAINFTASQISALNLTAGAANDTIDASAVTAGSFAFTANGGDGDDTITGTGGDDALLGGDGVDQLSGGNGNDTLTGGRGNDTILGEDGDDLLIWNNGDGSDLMEGGSGNDTVQVNGSDAAGDDFSITPNAPRVNFQRNNLGLFALDIGTTETLDVNSLGGDDTIAGSNGLDGLITLNLDGGVGTDQLTGGDGDDIIIGGPGADTANMGDGDDTFIWNPGDGSDIVEGEAGSDTMLFNGSAGDEVFAVEANGVRVTFTRNLGNIVMDLDDVEAIDLNTIGGSDTITTNDLTGTDLATFNVDLTDTTGAVTINGTASDDTITVTNAANITTIAGAQPPTITISNSDATDTLLINGLAGNDTISAEGVPAGLLAFTVDGGEGNDTITGTDGDDTLNGGVGNDFIDGARGADTANMGDSDDTFVWNPGDGSDIIEGGAGSDTMLFNGSGGDEVFAVEANGGRVTFTRDLGNIVMDLDDVEAIELNALGGADSVTVNDTTGTDLTTLDVDGGEGDDTISAEGVPTGLLAFTVDGGEGNDTITGTDGDDTLNGGAGNDFIDGARGADTANMGDGDDTFVWNPGDGSDIIEGGAGSDTMLFNGSAGDEVFAVEANGGRVTFTRDLGNIVMDLDDVEAIELNALGGADSVTVNDMTGTDLTTLDVDGGEGDDTISAEGVPAGLLAFTVDGGEGNDTITGTDGDDTLNGGAGNDFIDGARGADTANMGDGDDTFVWNPGDGSDIIEGGAGIDELLFNGANADETVEISANGNRVRFFRNPGNITMDLNDTERVTFNALGGIDTILVNDLSGTDTTDVFVNLGGSLATPNVGDGQPDSVTVVGTPGDDTITAKLVGSEIQVLGLPAVTHITGTDPSGDRLFVEGGGGNNTIDLKATVFVLPQPGLTSTTVVGADAGSPPVVVTIAPDGKVQSTTTVFDASFTGGVRVARADVNGDGIEDTVVGTGPGIATRVRVLDGVTGNELFVFEPFEASFTGGVFLAAGDLNGDGKADVVITPDEGGGPRVRVFSGANGSVLADFFGIEDPNFRGGARAAIGDIDGDGRGDLVVAAGFQGGPRVAGFSGQSIATGTPVKIFGDFFAFEETLRNGVFVAVGDINGDGFAELIAGGGPGGGPRVTAFSGKALLDNQYDLLANFFAGNPENRGGIRLAVKNLDGDTNSDLVVGDGTGAGSRVTAYAGSTILPDGTPPELFALDAIDNFTGGVFVG